MKALLSLLLGLSLSGTLLALLLMLLRRLAGSRLPSAFYYCAWLLVLLRFVLPLPGLLPGLARTAAAAPAPLPAAVSVAGTADETRGYASDFYHPGTPAAEAAPLPAGLITIGEGERRTAEESTPPLTALREVLRAPRFWLSVWAIGAVLSAAWYFEGYRRFRCELAPTLRAPLPEDRAIYESVTDAPCPRLYRSRAVRTPMLLGVLHPMIVLPDKGYSAPMLQGILGHELTHYRRGDVLFKWLAVLVSVLHWFNPVTRLFRSELDRACELACDERLLRGMDAREKQLYGDMLIALAADRSLPRSVVATSFAVEKRNLKERLNQIMTYKKRGRAALCLALAAMLLLSACGAAVGPRAAEASQTVAAAVSAPEEAAAPEASEPAAAVPTPDTRNYASEVTVDNVDDLLNALASHTVIFLKSGVYDLSTARTYGQDMDVTPYTWRETYDGYELVLRDLEDLVIAGLPGEEGAEIVISAVPRYANVLRFERCRDLTLSAFTAGHTVEPGQCAGGVLYFDSCRSVQVTGCRLYGCGILGIQAVNCEMLRADLCAIYDCSNGAVAAEACRDLRLVDCDIYECGLKNGIANALFDVRTSTGFAVINSDVHDNNALCLLRSTSADEVYLLGTDVHDNQFDTCFAYSLASPFVGGCAFRDNTETHSVLSDGRDSVFLPGDGGEIAVADLEKMTLDRDAYSYDGPAVKQAAAVTGIPGQDGMEYHVTTVDEFLAALGPDTTIYLDAELFDLSTASSYGGYGGTYYYWVDLYDGPGLVITGIQNLRLIGQGKEQTTVEAVPRYADVLCFRDCENVTVASLTAGHRRGEPGSCSGDVLAFESCRDVHVIDCGLFGCGVWGIRLNNSVTGEILRTEIYECSSGAATIFQTDGFVFSDCSVHDCVSPWNQAPCNTIMMSGSGDCSYNGTPLWNDANNEVGDGRAVGPGNVQEATNDLARRASLPAPADDTDGTIHLFFYETEITAEKGGFTLHVGESPITLSAQIWHDGAWLLDELLWGVSDPTVVDFRPSENGLSCSLQPLAPTEKGGAVLTVTTPDDSLTLEIPFYIIG
ncbi:MAG: M56 family metallopeptidase [Eubacteriales bacterium]|nr:M56 family metallopeptidase [Eubacteriales bacterium]